MKGIFLTLLFAIVITSCKQASFLNRRYTAGNYRAQVAPANQTKKLPLAKADSKIANKHSQPQEKNSNLKQTNASQIVSDQSQSKKTSSFQKANTISPCSHAPVISTYLQAKETPFIVPLNNPLVTHHHAIDLKKTRPLFFSALDFKIRIARTLTLIAIIVGVLAIFSGEITYLLAAFPLVVTLCILSIVLASKSFGQGFFSNVNVVFVILSNIVVLAFSIFIFALIFL